MKLIFTYDSTELEDIGQITGYDEKAVEEKHVLSIEKEGNDEPRKLYDVARDIKKETEDDAPCIISINQYLACAGEGFQWLQKNAGIALIKFLRMMGVRDHIVFVTPYADEPLRLIQDDPANLVISSRGITCTKYLHTFLKNSVDTLKTLANEQFDEKQDLKPYLKVDFELPQDERHNWANWWGIYRLLNVHNVVLEKEEEEKELKDKIDVKIKLPFLEEKLKILENREALFLYGHQDEDILDSLNPLSLSGQRVELTSIETIREWKKRKGITSNLKEIEQKYNAELNRYKSALVRNKLLNEEIGLNRSKILHYFLPEFRRILSKIEPTILLVDDQANQGWDELFQLIIYNSRKRPDSIFKNFSVSESEIDEKFYENVLDEIENLKPDFVLLDLRLKNEKGIWINAEELSGARLLKKIRQASKEWIRKQRVIITTASNKIWSLDELQKINTDEAGNQMGYLGYWVKEGLDVIMNEKESVGNYLRFLELFAKPMLANLDIPYQDE